MPAKSATRALDEDKQDDDVILVGDEEDYKPVKKVCGCDAFMYV